MQQANGLDERVSRIGKQNGPRRATHRREGVRFVGQESNRVGDQTVPPDESQKGAFDIRGKRVEGSHQTRVAIARNGGQARGA